MSAPAIDPALRAALARVIDEVLAAASAPDAIPQDADAYLTLPQAARLIGCHPDTLRKRWRTWSDFFPRVRRIPHVGFRIRRRDVLAYAEQYPVFGKRRARAS